MMGWMKVIISSCILQMKQSFSRAMFRYCVLIDPILFALITYVMYKDSGIGNFALYVVLGTGLSSLYNTICFSSAGDIERERFMGTLEVLMALPSRFRTILAGKVLGNTLLGLTSMTIAYIFVRVVFKAQMDIANPVLFMISFILSILSFLAMSLIMAVLFTLSRNARGLMNCMSYPVMILCGLFFPIEILPSWTRPFSYILSPTWAARLLHASMSGIDSYGRFALDMVLLIAVSVIYLGIFVILYDKIEKKIRVGATLGVC